MPKPQKLVVLAEDVNEESYEEQPMESYGMGLLQSMGFT